MSRPVQPRPLPRPAASVWATGQQDTQTQLAEGHYLPDTTRDAAGMPPAIATHAVAVYTRPGDTVLDPNCGAGTVLVEALRAGRHAVGITSHRRWWPIARGNVTTAKRDGATTDGMVLDGPPTPAAARLAGLTGHVDLLLTALRSPCPDRADQPRPPADPADRSVTDLRAILLQCRPLLRPGGHVIVTVHHQRHRGYLLDLVGDVLATGKAAGLLPTERCIALLAELRADRLITHTSLAQRRAAARNQRTTGHPISLTAHHEALIFRAPAEAAQAAALHCPPLAPLPRYERAHTTAAQRCAA
ncbi:DNA methyltransferase [Streptantibioticus ferralitis]|uniref:DNA methyltransferase n=1 Tax=Streptantibioticus ferralitis TaxID=236510 RepID=A0ABT5Z3C7_9ACTN|nr:DNA methyltransferase [Streptantibioticus ferralitis]MDF2258337.1 DNA methyltransferase [Streptantibioticus ferralitis]